MGEVFSDMMRELTSFEKKLVERQDVLEIRGKVYMWSVYPLVCRIIA